MKKKFYGQFILALGISVAVISCNNDDSTEEPAKSDTAGTAKTEPVQTPPQETVMDAVQAASGFYKTLNDTLGIRIVQVSYKPGDSSVLHSHPDYAVYAVSGSSATFYAKDGSKVVSELKTGTILVRPAEVHSVKNGSNKPINVILVEVRRPSQITSQDAAADAAKVAPNLYKSAGDTLGIRVLVVNYKPGQSSAMHSHPDNALYVIEGGKGEFTDKDGKKNVVELKKGMSMVRPGEAHSVKNVGNTTLKAILVEVNRAR